jgi:hypothetical protein
MTFRQRGGETIVSAKRKSGPIRDTPAQLLNQERFDEANRYAKTAIKDPVVKAFYKAAAIGGQTAYNVAFSDAFKGPEIELIDISGYHGNPEDIISIKASKFLILQMKVTILDQNGVIVEEGQALVSGEKWKYTVSRENEAVQGSSVIVTATNRPGKVTTKEVIDIQCI